MSRWMDEKTKKEAKSSWMNDGVAGKWRRRV